MTPVPCAMQVPDNRRKADNAASRDVDWFDIANLRGNLMIFPKYSSVLLDFVLPCDYCMSPQKTTQGSRTPYTRK